MQGTEIKVGVVVDDGGSTKKVTNGAGLLVKGLDNVTAAATRAGSAVKAAMAPSGGSKTMGAIKDATRSPEEGIEYGQARAAVGTGAAGRDFAKQAQGLGGLVHVYATFAANLFAVSAAFTALRDAASTENLVKGLDQLGASSGKSLGTLAKQLADTTDGALSLRDAMTAVSQASSAGLSNKQINDLAKVASKASQALGISMPDAVSRLSRGISKIEPELLDELGIFVKVEEATTKYAISMGKSATSLTDFEKRQAFANAVLEQGKQKFEAIDNIANPYDKLLASISNLATSGLELVNKVLGPIVRLLSESPAALAVVFTTIAGVLLKQAIPALSNWRTELVKSAEISAAAAKNTYENFRDYSIAKALAKEQKDLQPIQQKMNSSIADAQTALANTLSSKSKILAQSISGMVDPAAMEKLVSTELARRETILKKTQEQAVADTAASDAKKAAYADILKKQEAEIINIQTAQRAYATAAADQIAIQKRKTDTDTKQDKPGIWERMLGSRAERQQTGAVSKGILAQAGMDTQTKGISDAFSALRDNVKNGIPVFDEFGNVMEKRATPGLKGFSAALTLVKGTVIIATSAIATALSVVAPWLELVGLLVSVYHILDSTLSATTKKQEDFNSKIQTTEASVKTATDTLELYTKKSNKAFTIEGILAFNNVIVGTTDALFDQVTSFQKLEKAADWWYRLKQEAASYFFFTETNLEKLQKSTIESAIAIAKSVATSSREKEFKATLGESLQIKPEQIDSVEAWNKAFNKLTDDDKRKKILEIAENAKKVKTAVEAAAMATKAFVDGLSEINKLIGQVIQANQFNDLQGKLGVELVTSAHRLAEALANPLDALAALAKLGQDPKALAAMGADEKTINRLQDAVKLQDKLSKTLEARNKAQDALDTSKKGEGSAAKAYVAENVINRLGPIELPGMRSAIAKDIAAADSAVKESNTQLIRLKERGVEVAASLEGTITTMRNKGFEMVDIALKRAETAATITVEKFKATLASAAGIDTSRRETDLKLQELNIQEQIIKANFDLEIATNANTDMMAQLTAAQQILAANTILANKDSTDAEISLAKSMKDSANSFARIQGLVKGDEKASAGASDAEKRRASEIQDRDLLVKKRLAAQIAPISAQRTIAVIEGEVKKTEYLNKLEIERLGLEKQSYSLELARIAIGNQLNAYASEAYIDTKKTLDLQVLQKDNEASSKKIQDDIDKLNKNSLGYTKDEYAQKLANLQTQKQQLGYDYETKKLALEYSVIKEKTAAKQAEASLKSGIEIQNLQTANSIAEARINIEQKRFDLMAQMGMFDEQTIISLKAQAELELQKLKYQEQAATLAADVQQKQLALAGAKDAQAQAAANAKASPMSSAANLALGSANTAVAGAQAALDASKGKQDAAQKINDMTTESIKKQEELNQKFAAQKQYLADIASLATSLGSVFGDTGAKIGATLSVIADFGVKQKNAAEGIAEMGKKASEAYKKASEADDTEDREKYIEEGSKALDAQAKLQTKAKKDEITGYAQIAGAAKSMFKEKTGAYKLLDSMEKAMHTYKMVMMAKEVAMDLWKTGQSVVNSFTRMAATGEEAVVDGAAGVVNQAKGDPYTAFARMAAMAVFVGGILASIGKRGGSFSGGAENTGTGTTFGDKSAVSETVSKSTEVLSKSDPILMRNSMGMLRHLRNIDDNIAELGVALIKSLPGGGDIAAEKFGIQSGMKSSGIGNFLAGIPLAGNLLGGLVSALGFGTKTSIQGQGIMAGPQSVANIANRGFQGSYYADVTEKSKAFGITYNTKNYTQQTALDTELQRTLGLIFTNAGDLMVSASKTLKKDAGTVVSAVNSFVVDLGKINLSGLSAADQQKRFEGVVGQQLDKLVEYVYPEILAFIKVGEGAGTTLSRVSYGIESMSIALENFGIKAINYTDIVNKQGDVGAEIARQSIVTVETQSLIKDVIANADGAGQDIIDLYTQLDTLRNSIVDLGISQNFLSREVLIAAGGTEKFTDSLSKFYDKFTSAGYKANIETSKVVKQFNNLGLAIPKTRQEFTKMFTSLADSAPETAGAVLKVIDSLDTMYSYMEGTTESLDSMITRFRDFSKSVLDFKSNLLLSASSLSTPTEKYLLAKAELEATYTKVLAGDKDAQSKFQSAAQTFLDNSKIVNASSDAYQTDFNSVLTMIDKASISALASADVAQLQLDATTTTNTILSQINANIALIAGVPAAAGGGRVSGLTLVGEMGPELVDFTTPGRVYTADQTAGMFTPGRGSQAMAAVVVELQQLRQEVTQLRKDQQRQTGDIIVSNYDAHQKSSEEIATAVVESSQDVAWTARSKSEIK